MISEKHVHTERHHESKSSFTCPSIFLKILLVTKDWKKISKFVSGNGSGYLTLGDTGKMPGV
jgi:hypothetical protein